jgi:hypothetical protein
VLDCVLSEKSAFLDAQTDERLARSRSSCNSAIMCAPLLGKNRAGCPLRDCKDFVSV